MFLQAPELDREPGPELGPGPENEHENEPAAADILIPTGSDPPPTLSATLFRSAFVYSFIGPVKLTLYGSSIVD